MAGCSQAKELFFESRIVKPYLRLTSLPKKYMLRRLIFQCGRTVQSPSMYEYDDSSATDFQSMLIERRLLKRRVALGPARLVQHVELSGHLGEALSNIVKMTTRDPIKPREYGASGTLFLFGGQVLRFDAEASKALRARMYNTAGLWWLA